MKPVSRLFIIILLMARTVLIKIAKIIGQTIKVYENIFLEIKFILVKYQIHFISKLTTFMSYLSVRHILPTILFL